MLEFTVTEFSYRSYSSFLLWIFTFRLGSRGCIGKDGYPGVYDWDSDLWSPHHVDLQPNNFVSAKEERRRSSDSVTSRSLNPSVPCAASISRRLVGEHLFYIHPVAWRIAGRASSSTNKGLLAETLSCVRTLAPVVALTLWTQKTLNMMAY